MDLAINALEHRWDRGAFGWRQDDIFMAYLGLTQQAKDFLVTRSKNYDKNSRFPAFWGPNYDWTPDQDHGGVLMKAFQSMLMQADPYSKKIFLLPAWPKDWDVSFRLHAPYNTTIEGIVKNGNIESLKVTPESRREDVIVMIE
jgi:alpha-L-fucosidase 2